MSSRTLGIQILRRRLCNAGPRQVVQNATKPWGSLKKPCLFVLYCASIRNQKQLLDLHPKHYGHSVSILKNCQKGRKLTERGSELRFVPRWCPMPNLSESPE